MRTLTRFMDNLKLTLELLPETNDFTIETCPKPDGGNSSALRGIVLENATTTATRKMFARINTGGRSANDAEVRRGSLQTSPTS